MSARINLAGQRFGRWSVIAYAGDRKWYCQCDCGSKVEVAAASLKRGISMGCSACRRRDVNVTHGGKRTRLYNIWRGMKARCGNPNEPAYPDYGGRGIAICPEWQADFSAFRSWALSNGYADNLTIERSDNDGNYEPSNCQWITLAEQKMNRRNTVRVKWRGETITLVDLAAQVGLSYSLLKQRIRRYGWPVERAVSEPSRASNARRKVGKKRAGRLLDGVEHNGFPSQVNGEG
jgi:hypothetical protein